MKFCKRCEVEKPFADYVKCAPNKDGLWHVCKPCKKIMDWERVERQQAAGIPSRRVCRRCKVEQAFEDFPVMRNGPVGRSTMCKSCCSVESAERRWGISDILAKVDAGYCEICSDKLQRNNYAVDHDHKCCPSKIKSCGKCIRGLICQACNHGLGLFREEPERMLAAIDYLRRHSNAE